MKAVVVYESLWGNTAAIARAVAEGMGEGAVALSTREATPERMEGVDLIVAGAPVLGFSLPTEEMRENIRKQPQGRPADLSSPALRTWLDALPAGSGRGAAFETRIWWSPGGSTKTILAKLADAGYRTEGKGERFIVTGRRGPLKDGEIERAKAWGASLARA
jgi:flavorubredoxin